MTIQDILRKIKAGTEDPDGAWNSPGGIAVPDNLIDALLEHLIDEPSTITLALAHAREIGESAGHNLNCWGQARGHMVYTAVCTHCGKAVRVSLEEPGMAFSIEVESVNCL